MRFPHLFLIISAWAALAAYGQSYPIPDLGSSPRQRSSPSDQLQQYVDAGADGWRSEAVAGGIDQVLGSLGSRIVEGDKASLTANLAADSFAGSPFHEFRPEIVRDGAVEAVRLEPLEGQAPIGKAALEGGLKAFLADFAAVRQARFKILSMNDQDPAAVQARIRFHLVGSDREGATLEVHGYWKTTWSPGAGTWRLAGLEAEPYWRVRSSTPWFQDVTQAALAGATDAIRQLQQGVDWYSVTVDKAVGLDIYGHNGVAVGDVDGDGWEDFYVCQPAGLPNRLFRNLGNGRFEDISSRSGTNFLDLTSSALFFDFDNDADSDLLLVGRSLVLLSNDGSGVFEVVPPERSGFGAAAQTRTILTAVAAADYDLDGDLDVFAASYAWKAGEPGYRYPTPYHDATNGSPNFLFRNEGSGRFSDVTAAAGMDENNDRFSLAASWADYDRDGDPDLYVANDFGRNNLYRNDQGRFRDVAAAAGVEDLGAGMSVSWADYDNDGWLDLYVGNMFSSAGQRVATQEEFKPSASGELRSSLQRHAKGNSLFRNRGDGTFDDVTAGAGVALGLWAWSSQFLDIDADGWQDIVISNGYITNENSKDL